MDLIKKVEQYKKVVDEKLKQQNRLQGRLDAEMANLKKLGFDSLKDAEDWLEKAQAEYERKMKELEADVAEFEETYGEFLK